MGVLDFFRLRDVAHSDGLLKCRVPRGWVEELESDGTRVLWNPQGISGSLRITLITAKREAPYAGNPARFLLGDAKDGATDVELPNGNAFRRFRTETAEDGEALAIHWFYVANYVAPRYYRMAIFSFTTRLAEENEPVIQQQLGVLARELPACQFSLATQAWEQ